MAKGGYTLTKDWNCKPGWGGLKKAYFTLTLTNNYITDGYDCALDDAHLGALRAVYLPPTVSGYVPSYNYTTHYLSFFYANNDGGADGPLIQVPDNTDIGLLAVKFSAEGTGV